MRMPERITAAVLPSARAQEGDVAPIFTTRFRRHVESFFAGHRVMRREFTQGPIQRVVPGCHTLAVSPGPKTTLWSYISVGGAVVTRPGCPATEFLVISKGDRAEHVDGWR